MYNIVFDRWGNGGILFIALTTHMNRTLTIKIICVLICAAMLSSDASFAFPYHQAENKDALAPNPASKLMSSYKEELEMLSNDATPIGAKDTQKLQERWDAVYRGDDKSF